MRASKQANDFLHEWTIDCMNERSAIIEILLSKNQRRDLYVKNKRGSERSGAPRARWPNYDNFLYFQEAIKIWKWSCSGRWNHTWYEKLGAIFLQVLNRNKMTLKQMEQEHLSPNSKETVKEVCWETVEIRFPVLFSCPIFAVKAISVYAVYLFTWEIKAIRKLYFYF